MIYIAPLQGRLLRGAPDSTTVKKSSFQAIIECVGINEYTVFFSILYQFNVKPLTILVSLCIYVMYR
jgi:hypothetical protein